MPKKLIIGSPQAMEREPPTEPPLGWWTPKPKRCTEPECWCNRTQWKTSTRKSLRRIK